MIDLLIDGVSLAGGLFLGLKLAPYYKRRRAKPLPTIKQLLLKAGVETGVLASNDSQKGDFLGRPIFLGGLSFYDATNLPLKMLLAVNLPGEHKCDCGVPLYCLYEIVEIADKGRKARRLCSVCLNDNCARIVKNSAHAVDSVYLESVEQAENTKDLLSAIYIKKSQEAFSLLEENL